MKWKFKQKLKSMKYLMVALVFFLGISPIKVYAAEPLVQTNTTIETLEMLSANINFTRKDNISSRALLHNCLISVYSGSSGMEVAFMTGCSQIASSIGVKEIAIKQKVWYGWKTVATSSGGYNTNDTVYIGTILYTNAIKGETYRITCTHYADADEYTEVQGELDVIFTY